MKTGIMVRVSTDEQAKEGYSIEAQKQRLTDFVSSQGWTIYDFYIDDGYSAKNLERPAMQRMIRDIKDKKLDVVLVYKLDRLVRSVLDLHTLLELFDKYDVKFKSATEMFDTTSAMGRFFITLVGAMAQWERENLAERVKMGMEEKAHQGERNGGPIPYGYNKQLLINPIEATLIKRIYKMYRSMGSKAIAKQLNKEGIPSKNGGLWGEFTIQYILTNPFYAGKIKFEDIISDGAHEPIIKEEEWNEVQEIRLSRQKEGKKATSIYPFTSVLKCGRCGSPMVGASRKRAKDRYKFYKCTGRFSYGICDFPIISEKSVEMSFLESMDWFPVMDEVAATKEEPEEDIREQLENELKEIQKRKKKWQLAYIEEAITLDDLKLRNQEDSKREEYIKKQLIELPQKEKSRLDINDLSNQLKELKKLWHKLDDNTKREFVQAQFDSITINTNATSKGGKGSIIPIEIIKVEY